MYGERNPKITGKLDVKTGISVPFCPCEKVGCINVCFLPHPEDQNFATVDVFMEYNT